MHFCPLTGNSLLSQSRAALNTASERQPPTTLDVAGTQASHSCVHLSEHQFTMFLALALITRQKNLSYPPGEALNCWFFLPFPAKPLLPPELNVQPQHTWGLGGEGWEPSFSLSSLAKSNQTKLLVRNQFYRKPSQMFFVQVGMFLLTSYCSFSSACYSTLESVSIIWFLKIKLNQLNAFAGEIHFPGKM